ncbi:MAG: phage portal protein family protein [Armatimonadota bacterium]|jgi:phage gp29-like protein
MKIPFLPRFGGRRLPPLKETASAGAFIKDFDFYNPDDLIGKRSYSIYDQMQRDAQVQACLTIKKLAVLSHGWEVHPASSEPRDVEIADFVRFALVDMRGSILNVLYNVLDALAKGFSVLEINYHIFEDGPHKGRVGIASIKAKDPSIFSFDTDEFLNVRSLKRTGPGPSQQVLPSDKFVVYSHMPRYESPYGTSDLRAAHKHYWSKDVLTRFMNLYLEKHGSPTAKGSYKRGTPKQAQEELLRVLDKIQQQTAIVIPDDVKVELLEAGRSGEAGYLQAIEWHDKQISRAILCQTLMTDEGVRVGSYALAKVHLDVLKMCLHKLKRDLEEAVMREQVIKRLVDFNFSAKSYPTFSLGPLEDADVAQLTEVIGKLVDGQVIKPDEEWIRGYLGLPTGKK